MLDEIKIMQFADGTLDPSEKEEVKKKSIIIQNIRKFWRITFTQVNY